MSLHSSNTRQIASYIGSKWDTADLIFQYMNLYGVQGVICGTSANKDNRILDNLRLIALIYTDYKLLRKVLASRLKEAIDNIINQIQSTSIKLIHPDL